MPLFKDVPRIDINSERSNFLESVSSLLRWARMNLAEFRRAEDYGKHAGLSSAEIAFVQQGYLVQSVTRLTNDLVDKMSMTSPVLLVPDFNAAEQEMMEDALNRYKEFLDKGIFDRLLETGTHTRLTARLAEIRKKLNLKEQE
jgi:hypothetical protein